MSKYREVTTPIRIALYAAMKRDWERTENALMEALSMVRQFRAESERGRAKA